MLASTVLLLLLGVLLGSGLLFALMLMPLVFRLLRDLSSRSFVANLFSLYYLFGAAVSGAALVLMFALPCTSSLMRTVLAAACAAYMLGWHELAPRILMARDTADEDSLRRLEQAGQILNSALLAITTALFAQVHLACG